MHFDNVFYINIHIPVPNSGSVNILCWTLRNSKLLEGGHVVRVVPEIGNGRADTVPETSAPTNERTDFSCRMTWRLSQTENHKRWPQPPTSSDFRRRYKTAGKHMLGLKRTCNETRFFVLCIPKGFSTYIYY